MLDPRDLSILSGLLDEVLELPDATARARWLESLPAEHARLKPQLAAAIEGRVPPAVDRRLDALARVGLQDEGPAAGRSIGPYRLVHLLGRGGMSQVWLARRSDRPSDPPVALKLPTLEAVDRGFLARFERERGFLALLDHPAIARLIDAGATAEGQPYLALELVEGLPLDRHCDAAGLGVDGRLALFRQVLDAVAHAHERGVLHRDLKPSNILVNERGEVRLLDFGIAKLMIDGEASPTELTQRWGRALTPDYASPEQFAGTTATPRSDVYALAVILYELLTGGRPFARPPGERHPAERTQALLQAPPASQAIREDAVVAAAEGGRAALARRLSGDLDDLLAAGLSHDPAGRPADARQLARGLAEAKRPSPLMGWWNLRHRRAAEAWQRQRLGVAVSVMALLVLLALGRVHRLAAGLDMLTSRPRPPAQQVVLVSIGRADHQALFHGSRPLTPEVLGQLLDRILAGGPAVVGVDIDTSPPAHAVLRQRFRGDALRRIVWARDLDPAPEGGLPHPRPVLGGPEATGLRSGLALSVADGSSGQLLWWRPSVATQQGALPTLAAELAGADPGPATHAVRYREADRLDVPASVVMAPGFAWGDRIRDRLVLLGGRYDSTDRHPTPLGTLSGLDVLAQTVETARHETAWRQPSVRDGLLIGLALIVGSVVAFERLRATPVRALAATAAGGMLLVAALAAAGIFANWPYASIVVLAVLGGRAISLVGSRLKVRPFQPARPG